MCAYTCKYVSKQMYLCKYQYRHITYHIRLYYACWQIIGEFTRSGETLWTAPRYLMDGYNSGEKNTSNLGTSIACMHMSGSVGGWMDGWMDGCMDGWMDGWMDGCLFVCLLACLVGWLVGGFCLFVCLFVCLFLCSYIYQYVYIPSGPVTSIKHIKEKNTVNVCPCVPHWNPRNDAVDGSEIPNNHRLDGAGQPCKRFQLPTSTGELIPDFWIINRYHPEFHVSYPIGSMYGIFTYMTFWTCFIFAEAKWLLLPARWESNWWPNVQGATRPPRERRRSWNFAGNHWNMTPTSPKQCTP